MKRLLTSLFGGGIEYEAPTLILTEIPAERGFDVSTGHGDIDNPNEEEWTNPWG